MQDDSPVVPVQFPWRPEEGFQALADLQEHLHAVHGPGLPDCPHLEILRLPKLSVSPGLPLSGQRDGFHCLSHLECGFSTHIPADHSRRTHVETNRYIDHPRAKAKWPLGQCLNLIIWNTLLNQAFFYTSWGHRQGNCFPKVRFFWFFTSRHGHAEL